MAEERPILVCLPYRGAIVVDASKAKDNLVSATFVA